MHYISEEQARELINHENAFHAVRDVFGSAAAGEAHNFPVVREALNYNDALYGFKSGFDRGNKILGVKSGGYWPGNEAKGLTNHQSTVILFDPETGQPSAFLGGNALTAYRTAASSAVSIDLLARDDSTVLGIMGAGFQSRFQIEAAVLRRKFTKIIGWNFHPEMLPNLAEVAETLGIPFEAVTPEELGRQSDVIITITSSFSPQLMADCIKPGTHIACMGTDTIGKQEVDPNILANSTVFTDEIEQSISLGEAQHAYNSKQLQADEITAIGKVITGSHVGRSTNDEITVFDGTGVGLQDLAVAEVVRQLSIEQGIGVELK